MFISHLTSAGDRRDLDEGVEGDLDVRELRERLLQKVSEYSAEDGLVRHQHDVFLPEASTVQSLPVA